MLVQYSKKTIHTINLLFILGNLLPLSLPIQASTEINCSINDTLLEKTVLERCKYTEEIRKLKLENYRASNIVDTLISSPSFLPALIGFLGLFFGWLASLFAYTKEKDTQRAKDTEDKERQLKEKYINFVKDLSSDSLSLRVSSASALLNFVKPNDVSFLDDILTTLPANLKRSVCNDPSVQELLTRVLEKAIRTKLSVFNKSSSDNLLNTLNLSRTVLFRPDFRGFDFSGIEVDIAFSKMRYANLSEAKLPKLRGIGVCLNGARLYKCNLHEARLNESKCNNSQFQKSILTSATFKNAKLRKAKFYQSRLQSAHFDGANLKGADFTGANLNNTYFIGAQFDDFARLSILKSYRKKTDKKRSWERAHFDKKELANLRRLDGVMSQSEKITIV